MPQISDFKKITEFGLHTGRSGWALSIVRGFRITGKIALQFRTEAHDVLHLGMFGPPNTSPTGAQFGQVASTIGADQRVTTLNGWLTW